MKDNERKEEEISCKKMRENERQGKATKANERN